MFNTENKVQKYHRCNSVYCVIFISGSCIRDKIPNTYEGWVNLLLLQNQSSTLKQLCSAAGKNGEKKHFSLSLGTYILYLWIKHTPSPSFSLHFLYLIVFYKFCSEVSFETCGKTSHWLQCTFYQTAKRTLSTWASPCMQKEHIL